jgi:hypothetical protein
MQLTIDINDLALKRAKKAAELEGVPVSKWAGNKVAEATEEIGDTADEWPEEFFAYFGCLAESDLERPPQGRYEDDAPRVEL